VAVAPNASAQKTWPISDSGNWYDLTISANGIERRFAGRMENGQNLTSDPAMAS
jgi:phospholipase C